MSYIVLRSNDVNSFVGVLNFGNNTIYIIIVYPYGCHHDKKGSSIYCGPHNGDYPPEKNPKLVFCSI